MKRFRDGELNTGFADVETPCINSAFAARFVSFSILTSINCTEKKKNKN